MIWKSEYFCGNRISAYGLENGYVDYATLAKSFDAVLNNEIMEKTYGIGEWEMENGWIDNSDEIDEIREEIENLEEERDAAAEKLESLEDDAAEDLTEEEDARISAEMEKMEDEIQRLEDEIQEKENEIERLEDEQDNNNEICDLFANAFLDLCRRGYDYFDDNENLFSFWEEESELMNYYDCFIDDEMDGGKALRRVVTKTYYFN